MKKIKVSICCDPKIMEILRELAQNSKRSVSQMGELLLLEAIAARGIDTKE